MDDLIKTIIEKIPRKMVIGVFAMWMISEHTKGLEPDKQVWGLLGMTIIGLASIGTHFWLELRHPSNGNANLGDQK